MARAKKGTITIENFRGMLRLRLPRPWFNGKLKYFSLSLPDTTANQLIAKAKANLMENDYIYERFDFTLEKYKLTTAEPDPEIALADLFLDYLNLKQKTLARSSMKNLISVHNKLLTMPENVTRNPKLVRAWLLEHNTQNQAKKDLTQIKACCAWALDEGIIEKNPFETVKTIKKIPSDHEPDPFTVEEREIIINAFKEHEPHFFDFIRFLFFTGCRPSEACGLKWENIDFISKQIIILEAVVEGHHHDDTKTHKKRRFPLSQQVEEILLSQPRLNDNVFYSEKGKFINMNNFTRRQWARIFKLIPVRKRDCYQTRHTFITMCISAGVPIPDIASWVGNSPTMILNHYAGLTRSSIPLL